jgi:aminoglycoside/choline kinase family phosphotransferase
MLKGWWTEEHAARPTLAQQRKLIETVNESLVDSGIEFTYTLRHLDNKMRTLMVAHQKQAAKSDSSLLRSAPSS